MNGVFLVGAFATNASVVNANVVNAGGAASPGRDHRYATTAAECAERKYPQLNNKLSEIHAAHNIGTAQPTKML